MKKPIAISLGLFLFLFGLAFAKAMKYHPASELKNSRTPASAVKSE